MQAARSAKVEAFVRPDERDVGRRLTELGAAAWAHDATQAGGGARITYVRDALSADMTFHLLARYSPHVLTTLIQALLRDSADIIAAQQRKRDDDGGGQETSETQRARAPAVVEPSSGAGQIQAETQKAHARPAAALTAMADRQQAAMAGRAATLGRLSALETVTLDGKPVGDMTPADALAWAGNSERTARFVRMLCSNLPLHEPIRARIRPDMADEIFARSEKEP